MRGEIDQISSIVANNNQNRRRSAMSVMQQPNNGQKSGRKSIALDTSTNATTVKDNEAKIGPANDKNKGAPMRF